MKRNKVTYLTHDEAHKEAMKDFGYRFWYWLMWPLYALLRLWVKVKHL